MTPQIGDKRRHCGQTWVVLGVGEIVRDHLLLLQCIDTGEREYRLWSEFSKWGRE
jgi:hypothetical protein